MINRYKDHAANESTHLAWMRTAIEVMAIVSLIEKSDFIDTIVLIALFLPAYMNIQSMKSINTIPNIGYVGHL